MARFKFPLPTPYTVLFPFKRGLEAIKGDLDIDSTTGPCPCSRPARGVPHTLKCGDYLEQTPKAAATKPKKTRRTGLVLNG